MYTIVVGCGQRRRKNLANFDLFPPSHSHQISKSFTVATVETSNYICLYTSP